MHDIIRQKPVRFDSGTTRETIFDGWEIVLEYAGEGGGPWLVDLSHLRRWDYQHTSLDSRAPAGLEVPARPGQVRIQDGRLIGRLNQIQVAIWHLDRREIREMPAEKGFTDLTEAHCMLAVVGMHAPAVMEHVCNLDLFHPGRATPFLTQGPIMHVPCQVVTLSQQSVLMTFSRGYGQTFADAMLHAASSSGLRPGGEDVFDRGGVVIVGAATAHQNSEARALARASTDQRPGLHDDVRLMTSEAEPRSTDNNGITSVTEAPAALSHRRNTASCLRNPGRSRGR